MAKKSLRTAVDIGILITVLIFVWQNISEHNRDMGNLKNELSSLKEEIAKNREGVDIMIKNELGPPHFYNIAFVLENLKEATRDSRIGDTFVKDRLIVRLADLQRLAQDLETANSFFGPENQITALSFRDGILRSQLNGTIRLDINLRLDIVVLDRYLSCLKAKNSYLNCSVPTEEYMQAMHAETKTIIQALREKFGLECQLDGSEIRCEPGPLVGNLDGMCLPLLQMIQS